MNVIKAIGTIEFDPTNMTKKHEKQASWKRVAMVMLDGDIAEYYAWFLKRRHRVILNKPLRGAHVTFINDHEGETNGKWDAVKADWDKTEVSLRLNVDVRTNAEFWWMNVLPNDTLNALRTDLGLGKPHYPFHLTLGYPNIKHEEHSHYILKLIRMGLVN